MAIAQATEATLHSTGYVNTLTQAINCSGSNTYLIVVIGTRNPADVTGVTYNGVAMTKVAERNPGTNTCGVTIWGLVSPDSGSNNVVVSLSGYKLLSLYATCLTGVEPTGPIEATVTSEGYSTAAASTLTALSDNSWVIAAQNVKTDSAGTILAGITALENSAHSDVNLGVTMVSYKEVDSTSATVGYTLPAADNWASVGIAVKEYVTPPAPTTGYRIIIC